jgi:hypothetical protein
MWHKDKECRCDYTSECVNLIVEAERMTLQQERDELQEQLAEQKSYAGDLLLDRLAAERDITRLTEERDLADAECHRLVTQEVDPERRARRKAEAERDALQEQLDEQRARSDAAVEMMKHSDAELLKQMEKADALQERLRETGEISERRRVDIVEACDLLVDQGGLAAGLVPAIHNLKHEAHNLIVKLAKYTDGVVGTMKEVMEIVGDDDGPTADYGPAFCQLNRDGQRLLEKVRTYLGEPSPLPEGFVDVWGPRVIPCKQCGEPVEDVRRCYAVPMCYACLPPPPELPTIETPPEVIDEIMVRSREFDMLEKLAGIIEEHEVDGLTDEERAAFNEATLHLGWKPPTLGEPSPPKGDE